MPEITASTIAAADRGSLVARALIDRAMLEAISPTLKRARRNVADKEKTRTPQAYHGRPWKLPIDLRCPVSRDGRPRSADGATSFHFRVTTISRRDNSAAAATVNRAAGHEAYLVTERSEDAVARQLAERYLVQPKSDQSELTVDGRALLVRSSIGNTLAAREAFWNARWADARKAGVEAIELFPGRGSQLAWRSLANDGDAPEIIAAAATAIAAALDGGDAVDKRVVVPVDTGELRAWAASLGDRFGGRKADRMVHHREPRGGAVQEQFEFELPADLPLDQVDTIITDLANTLQNFGLAFTIVVHAPDDRNDRRNLHGHMVMYRRKLPVGEDGNLDLGDPGVALRPGDIAALLDTPLNRSTTHHSKLAAADVTALRSRYASMVNRELGKAGTDRRFDPRSYAEMGINKSPEFHLGNDGFTLLQAGVMTERARENAIRSWQAAMQESEAVLEAERAHHARLAKAWERDLDSVSSFDSAPILATIDRYRDTAARLSDEAMSLARFDLHEAMARSAAERLVRTSGDLIEARKRRDRRWRDERDVLARNRLATAHLEELEEALSPHREPIARQRDVAAQLRSQLANLDVEITGVIASAKAELAQATIWSEETVLCPSRYPAKLRPSDHCQALIDQIFTQANVGSTIGADRLCLIHKASGDGSMMTIDGLRPADVELMQDARWRRRLEPAFAKAYDIQRKAVDRLLFYVRKHGRATLERGHTRTGDRIDSTLVRLRDAYSQHPEFLSGLAAAEATYRRRHDDVGTPVASAWQSLERDEPTPAADIVVDEGFELPAVVEPSVGQDPDRPQPVDALAAEQPRSPIVANGAQSIGAAGSNAGDRAERLGRVAGEPVDQLAVPSKVAGPNTKAPVPVLSRPDPRPIEPDILPATVGAVAVVPVKAVASDMDVATSQPDTVQSERADIIAPTNPVVVAKREGAAEVPSAKADATLPSVQKSARRPDPKKPVGLKETLSVPNPIKAESSPTLEPEIAIDPKPRARSLGGEHHGATMPPQRKKSVEGRASKTGGRPTDILRDHIAAASSSPDRDTVLTRWQSRIHTWASKGGRTEEEFRRSLLLKSACRLAVYRDFDMVLNAAGQLDLFVRTDEAKALAEQLCAMSDGRRSLRMIAANLPPLADHRGFVRIQIAPESSQMDHGAEIGSALGGPERE